MWLHITSSLFTLTWEVVSLNSAGAVTLFCCVCVALQALAPDTYRLRLLNGCNSRVLQLRFAQTSTSVTDLGNANNNTELYTLVPFYVVGNEAGFFPKLQVCVLLCVLASVTGNTAVCTPVCVTCNPIHTVMAPHSWSNQLRGTLAASETLLLCMRVCVYVQGPFTSLIMGPAERFDVIIDLSGKEGRAQLQSVLHLARRWAN